MRVFISKHDLHELCIYKLAYKIGVQCCETGNIGRGHACNIPSFINHILDNTALYPKLHRKLQQKLSRVNCPKLQQLETQTLSLFSNLNLSFLRIFTSRF
jgi:hypothetical protein